MATQELVAETLSAWREAERILERLTPGTPDHETARLLALELHALFVELTQQRDASAARLMSSRMTIRHAHQLLSGIGSGR